MLSEQRHARASQAIKILIKITHTPCLPAAGSCCAMAFADNERNLQHLFDSQGILIIFMRTFITLDYSNRKIWRPSRSAYRQIDVTCCWPRTSLSCSGTHIWRNTLSSTFTRGKWSLLDGFFYQILNHVSSLQWNCAIAEQSTAGRVALSALCTLHRRWQRADLGAQLRYILSPRGAQHARLSRESRCHTGRRLQRNSRLVVRRWVRISNRLA